MRPQTLFFLLVTFGTLLAAYPSIAQQAHELDPEHLADLIESQQSAVSRFAAEYKLSYGTVEGDRPLESRFQPLTPSYEVIGAVAVDTTTDAIHVRQSEDLFGPGQHATKEYLFTGATGTSLYPVPGQLSQHQAEVEPRRPEELAANYGGHMRPEEWSYRPVLGQNLADVVRSAKHVEVDREIMQGHNTLRVTLLVGSDTAVNVDGSAKLGKRYSLHRVWLVPEYNMLPARIDLLRQQHFGDLEGLPITTRIQSDFHEVQPGLWFPFSARSYHFYSNKPATVVDAKVQAVHFNTDVQIPDRLNFPLGTHVTDTIAGMKYRPGPSASEIDDAIEESLHALESDTIVADTEPSTVSNLSTAAPTGTSRGGGGGSAVARALWLAPAAVCCTIVLIGTTAWMRKKARRASQEQNTH